ncbi:MAG: hypothetical protein V1888_02630 [archaeon]
MMAKKSGVGNRKSVVRACPTEEVEEKVSKVVIENENKQLIWFFVVVGLVFALILVPYFWVESNKSFQFGGIDWVIESYAEPTGDIFHGRFVSLTNENLYYNVFLRNDPRENDIPVSGKLDNFWSHEAISLSPEVDACRGDLSRVMLDLSAFLKQGVGAFVIESGSINEEVANGSGRKFLTCDDAVEKTVVIVGIGEPRIIQDEMNPSCYTIYAEDCGDSKSIEKFMVRSIEDFRDYPTE